jgi:phage terminase large subunit-like protein
MKRRYASMYASPVDKEVIEDGTIDGVNQYKKDTPGQGIEEDEIEEGLGLQLKMAFDDAKIKTKPRKGKIVIAKKDKKKAMDVLSKTLPSKLKKYVDKAVDNFLVFEEVELDEGKFKKGDIVIPNMGPHKGDKHEIIHDYGDGSYNIKPLTHPRNIKYKLGASKAKENQLKLVKEEVELDEATPMYPPTIKNLRMIVKDKQNQVFMFKVGKARVDLFTASAIIAVYDGLKKPEHKKKLEDMIKTKEGFLKTQAFAMKMVK